MFSNDPNTPIHQLDHREYRKKMEAKTLLLVCEYDKESLCFSPKRGTPKMFMALTDTVNKSG